MHWGGRPWRQPSRPGCTAHGDGRAAGDVALAAGQGPVPHRGEASPRVAQNGAHAAPRFPPSVLPDPGESHRSVLRGVFSPRPRGAPRLRTPGVRPSARTPSHPSPGRRARDAPLQPPPAVRTGRGPSAEGGPRQGSAWGGGSRNVSRAREATMGRGRAGPPAGRISTSARALSSAVPKRRSAFPPHTPCPARPLWLPLLWFLVTCELQVPLWNRTRRKDNFWRPRGRGRCVCKVLEEES